MIDAAAGGGNTMLLDDDYSNKPASYYVQPRADYVRLLPLDANASILELGCANGATGALALREGRCARYVDIEMFEPMAREAQAVLTTVHVGDVGTMTLPYPPASFDAFIASEVLEHLIDPYAVLARIAPLLKPGALVLASSPNIGWWKNIRDLVRGRFDYTESGMMDRTHLRWFTPASFARMFADAGIVADRIAPLNPPGRKGRLLRMLSRGRFDSLLYYQIDFHGHRAAPPPA